MHDILRKKRIQLIALVIGISSLFTLNAQAQLRDNLNLPNSDDKFYHVGIVIMSAQSRFQISMHPQFLQQTPDDSILAVFPENRIGLGLGGMHTFRINNRFEARVVFPQLLFVNQTLTYQLKTPNTLLGETPIMTQNVESIHLGIPVQLKLRSDRINNFRVYMMGGFKIETDLSSKARAKNAENLIKLKSFDYGVEAGIGFNFYMPFFILSPEIKISNGINSVHSRDANLKFSNVIDKIQSRMIVFSLIFEG